MKKPLLSTAFLALLAALPAGLFAQPVTAYLSNSQLDIALRSDGLLFADSAGGHFLVPAEPGGVPEISVMHAAGLWLGGVDPAGNMFYSATDSANTQQHFQPGYILPATGEYHPEFNKVWTIRKSDVIQHLQDWQDNHHIDQPVAAVFAWPGSGNLFSLQYNGFGVPDLGITGWRSLAPFQDQNGNGYYEPDQGEYPRIYLSDMNDHPDAMAWWTFCSPGAGRTGTNIGATAFLFDCPENPAVSRSVFVDLHLLSTHPFSLDSSRIGLFCDFAIGDEQDDYIGCDTLENHNYIFSYNADSHDESGFGDRPPVVAVNMLLDGDLEWSSPSHYAPFGAASNNLWTPPPSGPWADLEHYNLLSGSMKNGDPLPAGGWMFADLPVDLDHWATFLGDPTPRNMDAVLVAPALHWPVNTYQHAILAFSYYRNDAEPGVDANLAAMFARNPWISDTLNTAFFGFDAFSIGDYCAYSLPLDTRSPEAAVPVRIVPNPATDQFTLKLPEAARTGECLVYNGAGTFVRRYALTGEESPSFSCRDWLPGLYWVRVTGAEGVAGVGKIVVDK